MVGSSKILTVSYGTFSCTLEGFDDSFGSMKAIAEYFRDLAQEDRYFGAEPPTPDAEMLARIAEREISRRVEAQMDERGVHLRATAPAAVAAIDAAADTAADAAMAEETVEPEPAGTVDPVEEAPQPASAIAEVAETPAADAPIAEAEAEAEVAMPPVMDAPEVDPFAASAFMAAPAEAAPAAPAAPSADAAGDPSGIAAKLKRIRAVVGVPEADMGEIDAPKGANFPDVADSAVEEDDTAVAEEIADAMPGFDTAVAEDEDTSSTASADDAAPEETADESTVADDADAAEDDMPEAVIAEAEVAADDADDILGMDEEDIATADADIVEDEPDAEDSVAVDATEDTVAKADDTPLTAMADLADPVEDVSASVDLDVAADTDAAAPDADTDEAAFGATLADAIATAHTLDAAPADDIVSSDEADIAVEDEIPADTAQGDDQNGDQDDDVASNAIAAVEAMMETTATADSAATDTITTDVAEADEDAMWAKAALASLDDDAADMAPSQPAFDTADDAATTEDIVQDDDQGDTVLEAAELDDDLSSDLNDIDPSAPPAPTAKGPARIVRIRKDGPAEIVTMDDDQSDGLDVALKTEEADVAEETPVQDNADTAAEAEAAFAAFAALDETAQPAVTDNDIAAEVTAAMDAATSADAPAEAEIAAQEPAEAEATAPVADLPEVAAPTVAQDDHEDIRAAIAAAMPAGSLSDDDEDDLQRELAEVAQEVVVIADEAPAAEEITIPEIAAEAEAEVETTEAVTTEEVAEAPLADEAEVASDTPELTQKTGRSRRRLPNADYQVTRMINQADEALNEPAGSRRRNAIAQLKAAVAATEAARQLGDDADKQASAENAFRNDLNEVVRPSQIIEADAAERPRAAAPLKLVASQRVDEAETPSAAPTVSDGEFGSFAQFAASMGATELEDLLEAAAAYTSFVEGVEDFSRPQIMKKVQMTTQEEFSREDGLRSFGTLLRQGRISKVRNGRFQVSEQTRFRPDARSA